jgi:hypothetical protein
MYFIISDFIMKKSSTLVVAILCFGLGLMYLKLGQSSMSSGSPQTTNSHDYKRKANSFDSSDAMKYQKFLAKYTPGYDKNCILTLQNKYKGRGDLPLRIPAENELDPLSENVITCLYHRYVTTIQTFCAFKDRLGEVRRNGWFICADPVYAPKKNCVVFRSNKAFPEDKFSADMASRYKCKIHVTPLSSADTLPSWMDKTNTSNSIIDILTMSASSTSDLDLINKMVQDKSIQKVKQLSLELHFDPQNTKKQNYIKILKSLRMLYESGLRIVWYDRPFHCATFKFNRCYAVYFVQPNLRDKTATSAMSFDLPTEVKIRNMKTTEISDLYFKYIQTSQFFCQQILRIGKLTDGGWDVCHDRMQLDKNPCIVYSFGVLDDLSFDDDIATTYNCSVHSFDPTTPFPTHQHAPQVWFHRLGIGIEHKKFGAGYIAPLQEIRADLRHQSTPLAILKADTEGAEWASIPNMINTNQLADVSQFFIEFHVNVNQITPNHLLVLKKLHDAGFRIFWYHMNPACQNKQQPLRSDCQEVYFINTKFKSKF